MEIKTKVLASEISRYGKAAAMRLLAWQPQIQAGVAVLSHDAALIALLTYATAELDVLFLPIDPAWPDAQVLHLLKQTGIELVVSERELPVSSCLSPKDFSGLSLGNRSRWERPDTHLAWVIATSGTEGLPKGVMLSAGNLKAAARASQAVTPLGQADRWLVCLPLFHIGGLSILARCELAGAEAVLSLPFSVERVKADLVQTGITHLSLVPTMLAQLIAAGVAPPPSLRHVLVGGAALTETLAHQAKALGWPIQPTYGMSETAAQVATLPVFPPDWSQGQVGQPLPGLTLRCEPEGQIAIRGDSVMAGYANPDRVRGQGLVDGWFITADIGEISADGQLTVKGRCDDVVVTGGKKIHPASIEPLLAACPGLREFSLFGVPDPLWGECLAVVYCGDGSESEVLEWCRRHLSGPYRPRAALRLEALPLLGNGKLDRKQMREALLRA